MILVGIGFGNERVLFPMNITLEKSYPEEEIAIVGDLFFKWLLFRQGFFG